MPNPISYRGRTDVTTLGSDISQIAPSSRHREVEHVVVQQQEDSLSVRTRQLFGAPAGIRTRINRLLNLRKVTTETKQSKYTIVIIASS